MLPLYIKGLDQLLQRPVGEMSVLLGNDFAFNLSFVENTTRLIVLLPAIVGLITILALIGVLFSKDLHRVFGVVSLVLSGIALVALLVGRGGIERLGISTQIPDWIVALASAEFRLGYWLALVGVVMIVIGSVLTFLDPSQPADDFDDFYSW